MVEFQGNIDRIDLPRFARFTLRNRTRGSGEWIELVAQGSIDIGHPICGYYREADQAEKNLQSFASSKVTSITEVEQGMYHVVTKSGSIYEIVLMQHEEKPVKRQSRTIVAKKTSAVRALLASIMRAFQGKDRL